MQIFSHGMQKLSRQGQDFRPKGLVVKVQSTAGAVINVRTSLVRIMWPAANFIYARIYESRVVNINNLLVSATLES